MNEVSAIGAGSTAKSTKEIQQLGQDQFMKLMLAQLKNQDPLKPLESTEFLSQLAQFSTVTGIQDVKGAVTDMVGSLRASQALQGAGLIGRSVVAVADHANFDGVTAVEGSIDVPDGASAAELTVRDTAGAIVRRLPLRIDGSSAAFAWDGRSERGTAAARGQYALEAVAQVGGRAESVPVQVQSRVASVSLDPTSGAIALETDHGTLAFAAVRRVK